MDDSQHSMDKFIDELVDQLADKVDEQGEDGEESYETEENEEGNETEEGEDEEGDETEDSEAEDAGDESEEDETEQGDETEEDEEGEAGDELVDQLADKLVGRVLKAPSLDNTDLDATTLGKPGELQMNQEDLTQGDEEELNGEEELDDGQLDQVLGLSGGAKAMKAMKAMAMKAMAMKAMKAMKTMKAMKAMKAMKKKKAMKKLKSFTQKRYAFLGKLTKTATGLTKGDLVKNKRGKIVSKKNMLRGQKNPWLQAVQKARAALKVKGLALVKKGSPLYTKAKEFYKR